MKHFESRSSLCLLLSSFFLRRFNEPSLAKIFRTLHFIMRNYLLCVVSRRTCLALNLHLKFIFRQGVM